jgi:hypothetical protein
VKTLTLSQRLAQVPAFICAVYASAPRRKLTHEALAKRSGLSLRMIERLAAKIVWKGVDSDVQSRYAEACQVDLLKPSIIRRYLKSTMKAKIPFPHLSKNSRAATLRRTTAYLSLP